jgi:hypothetical protein
MNIQNEKQAKLDLPYVIKSDISNYKEIDLSKRTVDLIPNTYYYFDMVGDVLVQGCCLKSIQDRGAKSDKPGKIKHLMHHNWEKIIARCDLIEETKINGNYVLHANSYFPESADSEQELIKYHEGLYDQHSIGYRYLNVEYVEPESEDWDKYLKVLINPDDAIKFGIMFIVKEIALFEYSTVMLGTNRLTDCLGVKSENKNIQYNNLITKLDAIYTSYKQGVKDKFILECQERQIKQMIYELIHTEPVDKSTFHKPDKASTQLDYEYINKNLKIF